jgi:hypothetical protein
MQARKLVRLLQEMIEKDPSVAYKKVCIDTEFGTSKGKAGFKYFEVSDAELRGTYWTDDNGCLTDNEREVIVIGNY